MGITIRREEIAIMKYIGAKDFFVRAPFIVEGIFIGLIGAAVPLVALYFAYGKVVNYVLERFEILNNIFRLSSGGAGISDITAGWINFSE